MCYLIVISHYHSKDIGLWPGKEEKRRNDRSITIHYFITSRIV